MSTPYTVLVYDSGTLVAALENATNPSYSRAKNSADQVSISLPRGDVKASLIDVGQRFEIVRESAEGRIVEESGYISEHGYTEDEYVINGYTEEITLARHLTPAQFGWPLQSELGTLDMLIENMQSAYVVERVKGDWVRSGTSTSDVDTTSNPTFVILAKLGNNTQYLTSGWISFTFSKTSEQTWERYRWVSDYDSDKQVVTSTVQHRTATTEGGLSSAIWSAENPGADTDVKGVELVDTTSNYLEVRVNLYTTDIDISAVLYSLEAIKREPSSITSVDYPIEATSIVIPGLEADNKSFLDVLIDVFDAVNWEFRVSNGSLIARENMGTSRLNDYTLVGS